MATKSALITVGTTAANILGLLRGTSIPAGASSSKTFSAQLNDQCRELQLKCDNGTIFVGQDSTVSPTNYGGKLLTGESKHLGDAEANTLNLSDFWVVGLAAGAKFSVEWTSI